jgi:hypothetical protein
MQTCGLVNVHGLYGGWAGVVIVVFPTRLSFKPFPSSDVTQSPIFLKH